MAVVVALLAGLVSIYQLNCLLYLMNAALYCQLKKQVFQSVSFSKQARRCRVLKRRRRRRFWVRFGRTRALWDNFVAERVVPEEWKENLECVRRIS